LLGGENGDDYLDGGLGADGLYGNDGNDTADYSARTVNLSLTQDGKANDGQAGEQDNLAFDVEVIKAGSGNDLIVASGVPNVVFGNAGNDTIDGSDGIDTLDGGAGSDRLISGSDAEVFYLFDQPTDRSDHNDRFPADLMLGGAGDDTLVPGTGDDFMFGGAGNDTADYSHYGSRPGIDVTLDGVRNDGYLAWGGYFLGVGDVYYSEADNVGADVENVIGTSKDDRLWGNDGANRLDGGPGKDLLDGGGGNDTLVGDHGPTFYDGEDLNIPDVDTLNGGTGDDLLLSRDGGGDVLDGGAGHDRARVDADDTRSNVEELLA
jgi:Ca2+-binding RTX toxin-like protein